MKKVARATTDREDIRGLNIMEYRDISDAGVLRGNLSKLPAPPSTVRLYGAKGHGVVDFKFSEKGIDVDVTGNVLSGAKMFLHLLSDLQDEYMLVKRR